MPLMFRLHILDEDDSYSSCCYNEFDECKRAYDDLNQKSLFDEIWITNEKESIVLKNFSMFYLNYRDKSDNHYILGSFKTLLEAKEKFVAVQKDEPHLFTDDYELYVTDEMDNEFFFT
ncbi:MAG: hypothetical protein CBD89_02555 [Cyanobacteria bacterium TMED229]|nr:MAG: hypothetical protein CBD89_02555 [Cyanobacteria bacterium TMED229]